MPFPAAFLTLSTLFVTGCTGPRQLGAGSSGDAASAPGLLVGQTKDSVPESTRAVIESTTGLKGTFNDRENVFKVTQPRTDIRVALEGRTLEPFMGLTSWAAFTPGVAAPAVLTGDLVVFEDEISPVMDALLGAGLSVTALHNHFVFEKPRTFFMHIGGEGEYEVLARGVKAGLEAVRSVRAANATVAESFPGAVAAAANAIPQAKIDAILALDGAVKSQSKDGMYKVVIGREVAMACGCRIGKEMGINTWLALCGDEANASCSGDFLTFAGELQPVLRTLRSHGIHIVTIHNHMEGETPAAVFLHFWGKGPAETLARGLGAALQAQSGKAAVARAAPPSDAAKAYLTKALDAMEHSMRRKTSIGLLCEARPWRRSRTLRTRRIPMRRSDGLSRSSMMGTVSSPHRPRGKLSKPPEMPLRLNPRHSPRPK